MDHDTTCNCFYGNSVCGNIFNVASLVVRRNSYFKTKRFSLLKDRLVNSVMKT